MIEVFRFACRVCAVLAFAAAASIDRPWSPPSPAGRNTGNFCCSVGFLLLALSWL